jgi:hypothetical protein
MYRVQAVDALGQMTDPLSVRTWIWGDTDNTGVADVDDLICVLDAFGGFFTQTCTPQSADLMPCTPDGLVDIEDLIGVIDAVSGYPYPCGSPCGGNFAVGGGSGAGESMPAPGCAAALTLVADKASMSADDSLTVDVYVNDVTDVRAYQIALDAVASDGAVLELSNVTTDTQRGDYIFAGLRHVSAVDRARGRMVAGLYEGRLTSTSATPAGAYYLGTFSFRPGTSTVGAVSGAVTVTLRETDTLLRDSLGHSIAVSNAANATVGIR